jgi:hypothetical protein
MIVGGYAKINKDKIQPSPALAAITGLLSGLNTRKKEMQDREDKQNKADMELGKWMKEFGLKERETVVKERGADLDEAKITSDIEMNQIKLDQANQQITNDIENTKIKYKDSLQKAYEYEQDPIRKERIMKIQLGLDKELMEFKSVIDEKSDERKNKLLMTQQSALETQRQAGDIASQAMIQAGQARINKENNARITSEGEKDRANRITVKGMDTGTESNDPKIKNFLSIQKANQSFFGTVLTSPNKIIDDMTAKYMGDRSQAEVDAWNELTLEQRKGLTEPVPVGLSKRAKGGWNILGWQTKIKAKPTEMLTGSDLINFRNATTQAMRNSLLSEHPDKKEALQYLIDKGASEVAAQAIIDEVYKKK